jgi:hypothetical protein
MKKGKTNNDPRTEYDFSKMSGGVRGKYLESYRSGTNLVRLDADVAKAFKSDKSVNDALRAVIQAAEALQSTKGSS